MIKLLLKLFSGVFIFLFSLFISASPSFASNLLLNPGFEDAVSGSPTSWTKNVSTAILSTSTTAKTGTASASINKTNGTTGLIYLYQDVDVEPDAFYSLSGYAIKNSSMFSWVILRISWRSSSNEISKADSSQLTSDSSDFQSLKIDSAQTPSQAIKARIELAANIVTANPNNPVLFDEIDFSQISAPDQPTPTPSLTKNSTSTPTPVKTPTPTPKPSTPIPSVAQSSKIKLATLSSTDPASILGESTKSAAVTPSATPIESNNKVKILGDSQNNIFRILIGIGIAIFVFSCGILLFQHFKNKKINNE